MLFQTDLTKQETHYFIDLLNNDYEKMRKAKFDALDADVINPKCRKTRWLMIERLDQAMEENQILVHKFDDHLTDIGRGRKLNG
jgi:predicted secreted Zn-dependent protease